MMNKNIQKTKKKLTIIFSVIVFTIIFVLWVVFFSTKYFREVNLEKQVFSKLADWVNQGRISVKDIMNFWTRLDKNFFNKSKNKANIKPNLRASFEPKGFINYILIDNNNSIIESNIKDDVELDFILEIKENQIFFEIQQENWFIIKKFLLDNDQWTFIILKDIRYNFWHYLEDIFGFLLMNLLFSLILYFIGFKFVNKAFIPVEENMQDMKDFIHNAGHELKTPISVIDSNIQLIDDLKIYDVEMTKELKNEVLRLNSIIDWLIQLSNIDLLKDTQKNNLKDIILDIIAELKYKIEDKKLKIDINIPENINIRANTDYLYMCVSNIIINAIKYNHNKWSISISYKDWVLKIKDSGVWIPESQIDKIFNRFYKADTSRSSEGFWIGLSLVNKIADIYSWDIDVKSKEGKSTTFKIIF